MAMPGLENVKFKKTTQQAGLRSPLNGFRPTVQKIEVRGDPLTGLPSRINVARATRPKQATIESAEFDRIVEASKANCPFCQENIEKSTPMFMDGLPDRIRVNRCCLFPNLYPFSGFHAVGVFSEEHYLGLDEFTHQMIEDCLTACLKYFKLVNSKHAGAKYWHVNWNYMPPSAASFIHPHVQIFVEPRPTPHEQRLIESSRTYHEEKGTNFWRDLVKAEKSLKKRFIGETTSVTWLASFAPQGNREVMAIFKGASSIASLENPEIAEFSTGLSRLLNGYHGIGVRSLNLTTFSGPCDEDLEEFYSLNARLISRPSPSPFYACDDGFMEKLHREPIIETLPEALAESLRMHF